MTKLPHELYDLDEASASKVLKHIAVSYDSGKSQHETIFSFDGSQSERLFCAFYVGYIVGLHTQYLFPSTASILQIAIRTKHDKLISKIAEDIASDFNAPADEIKQALFELIDSNGRKPSDGNLWKHLVYGLLMGVDHQASRRQSVENVLAFLATLVDMPIEDIAICLRRRKAELDEDRVRDVA